MSTSSYKNLQTLVDAFGSVNATALYCGVPQPTLQRVVAGTTRNARPQFWERISKATQIPIAWLRYDQGEEPPRVQEIRDVTRLPLSELLRMALNSGSK